ncbi:MAG: YeeE/YedE thiosulfate transporter family protein [Thermodesulfobacteriota bacterium]
MTESLTWLTALLGGALIGLSASLLLLGDGRIAGISGILAGVLTPVRGEVAWRVLFLAGLATGGIAVRLVAPRALAIEAPQALAVYAVAGVLVGLGARLGGGCTSGHGVCGVSRLSRRSLIATSAFIASGAATVYVVRHLLGALP